MKREGLRAARAHFNVMSANRAHPLPDRWSTLRKIYTAVIQVRAPVRQRFAGTPFLPPPATKEWGEDRGEGQSRAMETDVPLLLHAMEERGWLQLRRVGIKSCLSDSPIVM